jgi:hypothetical protein
LFCFKSNFWQQDIKEMQLLIPGTSLVSFDKNVSYYEGLYKNAIVSHKLCFNDPTGALEEMKTPL